MEAADCSANRGKNPSHINYIICQIVFRVFAAFATFAAALVMALNRQNTNLAGIVISANYKVSPAFEFFVIGNAIACGYSLVSLPFIFNATVLSYLLPILDVVNLGLVMASAAAASAIAYVGKKGNDKIGWFQVCPYVNKFCVRVGISLGFSFLGFLLFLVICSISSVYKTRLITKVQN